MMKNERTIDDYWKTYDNMHKSIDELFIESTKRAFYLHQSNYNVLMNAVSDYHEAIREYYHTIFNSNEVPNETGKFQFLEMATLLRKSVADILDKVVRMEHQYYKF